MTAGGPTFDQPDPGGDDGRDRRRLRAAVDAAVEPWVLLEAVRDPGGRVVDFVYRDLNRAALRQQGWSRADLLGRSVGETPSAVVSSGLLQFYVRCLDTGEPLALDDFAYEGRTMTDSSPQSHRYEIRAVRVDAEAISLTWRDVNQRYEANRAVALSEERYRLLAENSTDIVAHIRDLHIEWISPSVEEGFGEPPSHWIGRSLMQLLVDDYQPVLAEILRQTATGETVVRRLRLHGPGGVEHWVDFHAKLYTDSTGRIDGRTVSFRIIDDEVAAERALELARHEQAQADARYRKLMDSSVVPTSLNTTDGSFAAVNQSMCDFFGYPEERLLVTTWPELTVVDDHESDSAIVGAILAGDRDSHRATKQYIHADGHLMWGDLSLSCIRNPGGAVENTIYQIGDITAEVEARERLTRSERQNRLLAQSLQSDIDDAAKYLRSVLPADLAGPVSAVSRYLPAQTLGGDCFDFRWIDDDHLIFYLLDVSGHGVRSALVAVSVQNMLRSSGIGAETLLEPDQVLADLNRSFAMDRHDGSYFTIWFAVYQRSTRTLRYSAGGHPPALLFTGRRHTKLSDQGPPVGMLDDSAFTAVTLEVPRGSRILLYSDGAFELPLRAGKQASHADFMRLCGQLAESPQWSLDELIDELRSRSITNSFDDDCCLVVVSFD